MGETGGHCFPLIPKLGSLERHMELELDYKRAYGDYYRKKLGFIILF